MYVRVVLALPSICQSYTSACTAGAVPPLSAINSKLITCSGTTCSHSPRPPSRHPKPPPSHPNTRTSPPIRQQVLVNKVLKSPGGYLDLRAIIMMNLSKLYKRLYELLLAHKLAQAWVGNALGPLWSDGPAHLLAWVWRRVCVGVHWWESFGCFP